LPGETPVPPDRINRIVNQTVQALTDHWARMKAEGQDVVRGPIFVTKAGGCQSQPTLYRRSFPPIAKRAKLAPTRPYTLGHTSAVLLLAADVNVRVVSRRLGHSDIATTLKHYGHTLPEMQDKALGAMSALFAGPAKVDAEPNNTQMTHHVPASVIPVSS
jgi:integrase